MPNNNLQVVVEIQNKLDGLDQEIAQVDVLKAKSEEITASGNAQLEVFKQLGAQEAEIAAAQQRLAIESQLQVIAQTRFELTAVQVEGDARRGAQLQQELAIRNATLGVMRAETLSAQQVAALTAEEALLLGKVAVETEATAAGSLVAGMNLGKAKAEAITLSREIATGSVNARTLGALLGSLGSTLTIAGIAGYALYEGIVKASDESLKMTQDEAKLTAELSKSVAEWDRMAERAQSFSDRVHLADKMQVELARMSAEAAEFRAKDLEGWSHWEMKIGSIIRSVLSYALTSIPGYSGFGIDPRVPAQQRADDAKIKAQEDYKNAVRDANAELDKSKAKVDAWAAAEGNLPLGLATYKQKLTEAEAKLADLDAKRHADPTSEAALNAYVQQLGVVNDLRDKVNQLGDEEDKANKKVREGASARSLAHQELSNFLREEENLLRGIRSEQEQIKSDPFLGADAQRDALHNASLREQETILVEIKKTEEEIARLKAIGSPEEQAQIERLIGKLSELRTRFQQLGVEIQKTTAGGDLRSELANWVNSYGTASHQIAGTIQGTIGAAFDGINGMILSMGDRTESWQQKLVGVEKQVGSLFLTMLEHMAEQQAAQLLGITTTTTAQTESGAEILAAHGPAAAATAISSYGVAALVGEVLAIAAIGAIVAALGGGFREGGYTGLGADDQIAGAVHRNEFVFPSDRVQQYGLPLLQDMIDGRGLDHSEIYNRIAVTIPRMNLGGGNSGAGGLSSRASASPGVVNPKIHVFSFTDKQKLIDALIRSDAAKKFVIDTVDGSAHELGIGGRY